MRRVVVTGLGAVTPLGVGVKETWEGLVAGRSGVGLITRFDTSAFPTKIAAEVKGFDPEQWVEPRDIARMDMFIHFAMGAAKMAMDDSGFVIDGSNADRVGVYLGSGLGGLQSLEKYHSVYLERGPGRISPFFIPMLISNLAPGHIAMKYGAKGPNITTSTACAAASHAIGEAFHAIRSGTCDAVVAGGAEATITPMGVGGFCSMKALSTRNGAPEAASRPFDKERDGFVMGEGASILILEELESAKRRGATIFCEIAGYGASADAHHMTAPAPGGEGAVRAMRAALADGKIGPEQVDYINAHGTSTGLNDKFESMAIHTVFGSRAKSVAVSSTKSMTGHLLGASGAVEALACALAIRDSVAPPTINYTTPDPDCGELDVVPNTARQMSIRYALSNSFGFGGTNSVLLFKRFDG